MLFSIHVIFDDAVKEFRPFKTAGRKGSVAEKWGLMHAKILAEEGSAIGVALAGISKSRLKSHFRLLLAYKRKSIGEARLASGGDLEGVEGRDAIPVRIDSPASC